MNKIWDTETERQNWRIRRNIETLMRKRETEKGSNIDRLMFKRKRERWKKRKIDKSKEGLSVEIITMVP